MSLNKLGISIYPDEELEEESDGMDFGWVEITAFLVMFALAGYAIGRKK